MHTIIKTEPRQAVRLPARVRNLLWQCVCAGALLLAFAVWRGLDHRGDPDTFRFPPAWPGTRYLIRQGQMICCSGVDKLVIHSIPITGSKARILAEDSAEFVSPAGEFSLMFSTRDILYKSHKQPTLPTLQLVVSRGQSGAPISVGSTVPALAAPLLPPMKAPAPPSLPSLTSDLRTYLAPPETMRTQAVGEQRHALAAPVPELQRLRRVPLTGGTPQDVEGVSASWTTTVGGDWVYWLRLRPDDLTRVQRGKAAWCEVRGHSDLMMTSLTTGETRQRFTGLSTDTYLHADERGVFWTEPHPYPDPHRTLYYLRTTDPMPKVMPDFQGNLAALPPVEYQGRLYWLASDTPNILWRGDWLFSANLDGSDRRVIMGRKQSGKLLRQPLTLYHGGLYLFLQDDTLVQSVRSGNKIPPPAITLCLLHPERADPVEVVLNKAYGTNFDEDYLYFERIIEHRPLRAYLVSDDMSVEEEQILCRMRIPQ